MSENKENYNGFLLGFLTGSISGAIIALLYAPKSGKKLRRDINRKTDELIDNTEEYLNNVKDRAAGIIADGKRKAEHLISEAKKKTDFIKDKH